MFLNCLILFWADLGMMCWPIAGLPINKGGPYDAKTGREAPKILRKHHPEGSHLTRWLALGNMVKDSYCEHTSEWEIEALS